jgi:uncharacterized protein YdaU (DUF1376 family)
MGLTFEEDAAYRRLLDLFMEADGVLEGSLDELVRMTGAAKLSERKSVKKIAKKYFEFSNGVWLQKRAAVELQKRKDFCEKQRKNAIEGALKRWHGDSQRHSQRGSQKMPSHPHILNNPPCSPPQGDEEGRISAKGYGALRSLPECRLTVRQWLWARMNWAAHPRVSELDGEGFAEFVVNRALGMGEIRAWPSWLSKQMGLWLEDVGFVEGGGDVPPLAVGDPGLAGRNF